MTASPIVSTQWLADHLASPDLVVVDGSMFLPQAGRDAGKEYLQAHIPGAIRFDIDEISDHDSELPHTLPQPNLFSSKMRKLGIGDGQTIIAYDSLGYYSAPRVWWMLKIMGAKDVHVLDGGLKKWVAENRPVESGPVVRPERHFTARMNHSAVTDLESMKAAIQNGTWQILDARSSERFKGEIPEPRAGLRAGHMPGAINLPFTSLVNDDGTLKEQEDLKRILDDLGLKLDQPIATTCGSGVTAAVLTLALTLVGARDVKLYDGSWSEWGASQETNVVTGT